MAECLACGKVYRHEMGSKGIVCSLRCWGKVRTQLIPGSPHPRGKGGKREDLGIYVRSRWEANWARYLNLLVDHAKVVRWEYEPETFEFKGIKRGVRFYTPDFRVFYPDGRVEFQEVKGWLDQKGKTKLKRMAKYHPTVTVTLIGPKEYRAVAKVVSGLIPLWETSSSHGRFG